MDELIGKTNLVETLLRWSEELAQHGECSGCESDFLKTVIAKVEQQPVIDAKVVNRGQWEPDNYDDVESWDCSYCGAVVRHTTRYCPHCGARMDVCDSMPRDYLLSMIDEIKNCYDTDSDMLGVDVLKELIVLKVIRSLVKNFPYVGDDKNCVSCPALRDALAELKANWDRCGELDGVFDEVLSYIKTSEEYEAERIDSLYEEDWDK